MENTHNDEMEIDLMELFYALKRRIFFILAVGLLCGCLSAAYTNFFMTPIYTSTSSIRRQSELYKKVAESDKKRFVIIDAERTPNEMANQAVQYILSKYTEKL